MKYIDIHAHTNFAVYGDDRADVIDRALKNDTWLINVGTQQNTSQEAVALAESYAEGVYAIIGLHPIHTDKSYHDSKELGDEGAEFTSRGEIFDTDFYRNLAQSEKVVGIGECGLDYYRTTADSLDKQKTAFRAQIELALELDLPLMLHVRPSQNSMDAYWDVIEILRGYPSPRSAKATQGAPLAGEQVTALAAGGGGAALRGDVHFFAGDVEVAQAFLDLGFYLSFTGVITFAKEYEAVIRLAPLERIMTETDCPYVTPAPYRGQRNEPVYVSEVTKKIAEIKGVSVEEARDRIFENAKRLFGIK